MALALMVASCARHQQAYVIDPQSGRSIALMAQPQYAPPAYAQPQYVQPQYAPRSYAQPQYAPQSPPQLTCSRLISHRRR